MVFHKSQSLVVGYDLGRNSGKKARKEMWKYFKDRWDITYPTGSLLMKVGWKRIETSYSFELKVTCGLEEEEFAWNDFLIVKIFSGVSGFEP